MMAREGKRKRKDKDSGSDFGGGKAKAIKIIHFASFKQEGKYSKNIDN